MTVTLITGANKGLGRETARRLIEEGHTVYIGARSVERGEQRVTRARESEVGKLKPGMAIVLTIGALEPAKFGATR